MKKIVLLELEIEYCNQCVYFCVDRDENVKPPLNLKYTCGHSVENHLVNIKEGIPKWCPLTHHEIWNIEKK